MKSHLSQELAASRLLCLLYDQGLGLDLESRAILMEELSDEAGWDEQFRIELYGELEDLLKPNMSQDEAWNIIRRAIKHYWREYGISVSGS